MNDAPVGLGIRSIQDSTRDAAICAVLAECLAAELPA